MYVHRCYRSKDGSFVWDQFEEKMISVVDGKGRVLLKGIVKDGEVFQRIDDLESIDLRLLVKKVEQKEK